MCTEPVQSTQLGLWQKLIVHYASGGGFKPWDAKRVCGGSPYMQLLT